ncbi:MAG: carboxymuconolactone decarboxylase family protein [Planctomycetota bacterium]
MTPRIRALSDEQAPAASAKILDRVQDAIGMVPNLHRTLAHAPAALNAYTAMAGALGTGALDPQLRESIALATAAKNGCGYCASAHTLLGKGAGLDGEELTRNLAAESSEPARAAALKFVEELIARRGDVSDETLESVRREGFSDEEIAEIVTHVGLNTFTNFFNNFAHTEIDFPVVELESASTAS